MGSNSDARSGVLKRTLTTLFCDQATLRTDRPCMRQLRVQELSASSLIKTAWGSKFNFNPK